MSKKTNKYRWIFFLIGLAALGVMVYKLGVDTIWNNIKETGWWFFAIIGVWLVVYVINTFAFNAIIRDKSIPKEHYPSFLRVLKITISGYSINYITPVVSLGGEPYRILELQENVGTRKATSITLSYSMMHILSHIVFWMCSTILIVVFLRPSWGLTVGCAIMFAVFAFGLYLIFKGYKKGLIVKTFRILGKIPFMRKPMQRFNESKLQALQEVDKQIVTFYTQRKPTFFLSLGLEFLARVVSCFELVFIAWAIGLNMTLLDSVILYAGSTLFANLLFFSPMQLGTREGGLALTLKMMGFQGQLGVYTGLIMRIRELFWIAIGVILMRIKPSGVMDKTIKGVLIDYGGTIDTNGKHWSEVIFDAYQFHQITIQKEDFRKAYVYGEQSMEREQHLIKPEYTFKDVLEMKIAYQAEFLAAQKMITRDDIAKIVDFCYIYAKEMVDRQRKTLAELANKYPIALVSNFYGNLTSVLRDFNIAQYFQAVVESSVVGCRKPDSAIFSLGLQALHLNATDCVVVGDSYTNDIVPAKQLGCTAVWLKGIGWDTEEKDTRRYEPDYTIGQLADILNIKNIK